MPAKKKTEIKLTPEIRAKLMGISVVSDTVEYTMEIDVPDEFKPIFKLKAFTVEAAKKFKDIPEDEQDSAFEEIVRSHLVGWKNVIDLSTGKEYKFEAKEDGTCSDAKYYTLPIGLRANILNHLYQLAGLV